MSALGSILTHLRSSVVTSFFVLVVIISFAKSSVVAQDKLNTPSGHDSTNTVTLSNPSTDEEIRNNAAKMLRRDVRDIPTIVVPVNQFGALGDGIHDDSDAIERAAATVRNGEILVFPSGSYLYNRSIHIKSPDVILWGFGARLHGSNPDDQAIFIEGDRASALGLELTASQTERKEDLRHHRIVLLADGNEAIANTIEGGAAAGIFVFGARHFRVRDNVIRNTLADGIHVTGGSQSGIIAKNIVSGTGDDLIAVVSYREDHALSSDVLITNNDVSGNPWGRGIAVVGGRDVTISDNVIRDVAVGAGIYIAREANYNTYGTSNIVVRNNVIEHIQTRGEVLGGRPRNKQGALEVFADSEGDPDLIVRGVLIQGNVIRDALVDGVRALGDVCDIEVIDNNFEALGGRPIRTIKRGLSTVVWHRWQHWPFVHTTAKDGCGHQRVSCNRNILDGVLVSTAECDSFEGNTTGASVRDK